MRGECSSRLFGMIAKPLVPNCRRLVCQKKSSANLLRGAVEEEMVAERGSHRSTHGVSIDSARRKVELSLTKLVYGSFVILGC